MSDTSDPTYLATIRELSDRVVDAQRQIRILDAIKWDAAVETAFFAAGGRVLPPVDAAYYDARPLPYDPRDKRDEFRTIERDVARRLGDYNAVGRILRRMCEEYRAVIDMLEARGRRGFSQCSQELYGSASDAFHAGGPSLVDLTDVLEETLTNVDKSVIDLSEAKTISGAEAVPLLQAQLDGTFAHIGERVRVMLSDGIVADAAAGADYVKIRREGRFNRRDLRLLEIHEGWVHVGTTLNGARQPYCTFLSKGPPSSTVSQEGLAIFMEILAFVSHPARLRKLTNRVRAVGMAESGATFLDVYGLFLEQGFPEREAYANTMRVFRGSTPDGGPFTKDLTYTKGFTLTYNFVRLAVRKGRLELIPLLFCGKTTLEDLHVLRDLVSEGVVVPPVFLPPQLADPSALVAWMTYSNFLNRLNLDRIEADYTNIL